MEDGYKDILEFAKELKLHFGEDTIDQMYKLLDSGMSPKNLIQLLKEIRNELSGRIR
ncbi:uncharacterized protein Eint_021465 [Encephalitozoon intestinalis ATCC 50506]|uniref:Uncharacterized protein n=1 Tax=Encephalitozoon intestinalis (strain ATCC 50506) TaxID=876142 RepID=W8P8W9_ENCIT|nr:uncharacterized protein Eint_021465 [Encephalitozoon intestinalis ATCC 50506]AHL30083.1 hypothetical protein Eint_021465 [Encephalitozoon intestinalis ATCC 50506]UTX44798.1 hypothetical protein GPK93_02g03190 [Encephalitozoon intestinalis]